MIQYFAIPLILLLWEHFGSIKHLDIKPSFLIGNCTEPVQNFCISFGSYFARFSSYLYHMQLKEMARSAWNLIHSIFLFALAPVWSIKGYIETAYHEYEGSPYVIYLGSAILLILIACLLCRFRSRIPINTTRIAQIFNQNKEGFFLSFLVIGFVTGFYYWEVIYPKLTIWN